MRRNGKGKEENKKKMKKGRRKMRNVRVQRTEKN